MTHTPSYTYFVSDLHLGMHPREKSLEREKLFLQWLESVEDHASAIWFLGDTFDYWFEYRKVVPRGFTRFLGRLAELSDRGTEIHFFTGNHDVWMYDYLPREMGATVHRIPVIRKLGNHIFYLGHGDGLNKKDRGYRLLQAVFRNRFIQWCYARLHPNGTTAFAHWWSKKSRYTKGMYLEYAGFEKEDQLQFALEHSREHPEIDFYLFGHRHVPYDNRLNESTRAVCLGDWIVNFTYAVYDGNTLELKTYLDDRGSIIREEFTAQQDQP